MESCFSTGLSFSVLLLGETEDPNIKALRTRQMKNFQVVLMISQVKSQILLDPSLFFLAKLSHTVPI